MWNSMICLGIQDQKNFGCVETQDVWGVLVKGEALRECEGQVVKGLDPL